MHCVIFISPVAYFHVQIFPYRQCHTQNLVHPTHLSEYDAINTLPEITGWFIHRISEEANERKNE